MEINNEIWAIVPARSGSKAIKNKNIKIIKGKPLLAYSIIAAKKSKKIKKIVLSSDSIHYFKIASRYSKILFHKRPKKISNHKSTDLEFFLDFINKYKGKLPKYFVHLRPTTPFRNSKILDKVILKFLKNEKKYSSLRSVNEISNKIYKTVLIKDKKLFSPIYNSYSLDVINSSRQSYPKTYLGNGYIDIIKTKNLIKGFLHGKKVMPFVCKFKVNDIDNLNDLKAAKK